MFLFAACHANCQDKCDQNTGNCESCRDGYYTVDCSQCKLNQKKSSVGCQIIEIQIKR